VQIRTRRMDEVAEKGLAAHWKYKGVQSEANMDNWLKGIREILENPEMSAMDFMDNFKLNLYDDEVFVFTPNGDLHKLPKGATVLDFAFEIHTKLGAQCIGAILNGKNVPMKHVLCNGDQIQILTSQAQSPKQEWLNIVMTSRAKAKIRQALKESQSKDAEIGRETLKRRLKNWKIDFDEAKVMRLVKKMGYKSVTDMYVDVALEKLDVLAFRDEYLEFDKPVTQEETPASAENFIQKENQSPLAAKDDVLVIDQNLKDIDFTLAKCCHPIYGDEVFGFVSSQGGVKIHRMDCPNAPLLISKFGYRVVKACWAGKAGSRYAVTLRVVASDDIGIVTNVTSIISKEPQTALRSINVDSSDGIFIGTITIFVTDTNNLKSLIKKIKTIKGVKSVERTGA
ncbi:MAG: bifunctional (p)ppGpp synthetase/guanosine-3',5'-bis(diphosphate) 3'-pyrophosphohydrolase, partial [Paludibacteraceae bacterium]|nr:bifunctional (p)ppGpp synthetase/guanosine-3',5'-bis(diphosphate) 3'-pyrophosphohydrolase [Paludibacteraceae bacterium]